MPPLRSAQALPNLLFHLSVGDISRGKTHSVHEGETAILTCNYSIKYGLRPVCWGKACGTMWCHDEVIQTDGQRVTSKRSSRYTLKGDMLGGDVSLTIQQVKPTDASSYCCRVDIEGYFNDQKVVGNWSTGFGGGGGCLKSPNPRNNARPGSAPNKLRRQVPRSGGRLCSTAPSGDSQET
uniref:Ig-like domain-containing protein n=1 Tax=Erpetoichthys calabaricus TaxID=27687 RepID=A0A8C4SXY4_ERPCA